LGHGAQSRHTHTFLHRKAGRQADSPRTRHAGLFPRAVWLASQKSNTACTLTAHSSHSLPAQKRRTHKHTHTHTHTHTTSASVPRSPSLSHTHSSPLPPSPLRRLQSDTRCSLSPSFSRRSFVLFFAHHDARFLPSSPFLPLPDPRLSIPPILHSASYKLLHLTTEPRRDEACLPFRPSVVATPSPGRPSRITP